MRAGTQRLRGPALPGQSVSLFSLIVPALAQWTCLSSFLQRVLERCRSGQCSSLQSLALKRCLRREWNMPIRHLQALVRGRLDVGRLATVFTRLGS